MSSALSLVGWTFLPNLATRALQTILYGIFIRAGDAKPRPGEPRHAEHRRRIQIVVVTLFLLYSIYEADYDLCRAGDYYAILGLSHDATDREIKSRFRRLAALHHPDKVQQSSVGDATFRFMHLKTASETLLEPARRFAYDRFGPDVIRWTMCVTIRDHVVRGCTYLVAPYYAMAVVVMAGLGLLGYLEWGRYERWLTLFSLLLFEIRAVIRPTPPYVLDRILNPALVVLSRGAHPPLLPFQAVSLARRLVITIYIAFSQLGPLLAGGEKNASSPPSEASEEVILKEGIRHFETMAAAIDKDATALMQIEMAPFVDNAAVLGSMKGKMSEWLVRNTTRADPVVRDALGRSFARRRADALAGARSEGSPAPNGTAHRRHDVAS